ncbi:uncharacterized protein LOC108744915 isoform X2 [Agrilus planipennis]|uniref:Uncharacterized protein LOC108744915 isoform X2 n=1 Tax=Agrilus planipennis TaxID=224129 RepID=A0A7F5RP06_AGRPL|nr:uncharacterized protein LOC108744915 isoform X2 [Agrilus planipennis]
MKIISDRTTKVLVRALNMVYFVSQRNFRYSAAIREPVAIIKGKQPRWVNPCNLEQCFECLASGMTVFASGAAATPILLLNALAEVGKNKKLKGVKVYHMHTEGPAAYCAPELAENFTSYSVFMGGNVRKAVAEGRADTIPIFLHEIPYLFYRKILQPDFCVVSLSVPDEHGYCSTGTSVDCVRAAMQHSKLIVGQVNQQMPRTFGDGVIHVSQIDYAVCVNEKLPSHAHKKLSEAEEKIGKFIAENLVEDGATLQMGIGSIPDAVLAQLHSHKNLGIHSEMFADGVIGLVENGCVNNSKKTSYAGITVGSFLIGSQQLYDFVNNNPAVKMLVVDYVNNTKVVAQQKKMTAINSCIEVDLTGQVCSDSIGTRMYSGFGGQVDFLRGAGEAIDGKGKPILAMVSTTNKGQTKIVPTLKTGAGVVTTRAHVQYVVTEFGVAYLFGKGLRQRAYALINVAHPDHREALEKAAYERLKVKPCP